MNNNGPPYEGWLRTGLDSWKCPANSSCDLCGDCLEAKARPSVLSLGDAKWGSGEKALTCAVCGVDEDFVCSDCFVSWSPSWTRRVHLAAHLEALKERGLSRPEAARLVSQLTSPGKWVCFQCLIEGEVGFCAKKLLSAAQKARWMRVMSRADAQGWSPPTIVGVQTLTFKAKSTDAASACATDGSDDSVCALEEAHVADGSGSGCVAVASASSALV